MSHPARRFWVIAAIVVLGVAAAGLLAVRWALDPLLLRTLAESRLSAALGQPVRIGSVHLSFLPSLSVDGTDIVVGGASRESAASLEIHAIRLHPRLSSIFSRPVVIDHVEIEGMTLNAVRDAAGRWMLPLPAPGTAPAGTTAEDGRLDLAQVVLKRGRLTIADQQPSGRTPTPPVTAIDNIDATVQRAGNATRLEGLTASVGRSNVAGNGGIGAEGLRLSLRWTDLRGADLPLIFALFGTNAPDGLSFEGKNPLTLELRVDAAGRVSASGRVAADRAALGTLALTAFESPVSFVGNRLAVSPMAFRAYSGSGGGRLMVNAASSPATWALSATVQHLDVDQFVSANTTAKGKVSGSGALDVRLDGTSRVPVERTVAGTAVVSIANGTIRDFPLLAAVYSALKLGSPGDRDLRFQTLSATFDIANQRATTHDLVAKTGEMTMTAAGTIGFDQALAMTGTVRFSPARSDALVHSIKELSVLENGGGELEVPFAVAGTLSAPRFSIDVAGLMRRGLQNELKRRIGEGLRDLFKKKK
jgi:uncharacterized protein involved in outer membrane biogenesis